MRLQDHIDFTTLQWVKPELDDTLSIAREALESYVDNPGKRDTCARAPITCIRCTARCGWSSFTARRW